MGFGSLRVINEDRVAAGAGFGTHPHRDMEIISYVVEGALEHKDSMGTGSVIKAGDVQRMSAGTGVTHSEYNHEKASPVHFLQIWIVPERVGLKPSYEQKFFGEERHNVLRLVVSPDGSEGSVIVHQDARVSASLLDEGHVVTYKPQAGRQTWIQMISGQSKVLGQCLGPGDALAAVDEAELVFEAQSDAHFLVFDLKKETT